ncbi:hypothetical protein [Streptomyces sp. DSM 40907]|uniref:hypothetical protein n=1 Tax=Streptomyces kutzneri TaxID=3051179 RepID=UPI0028D19557|nr:hypothetical protein [Streptomyces sp. DSM 40907]
MRKIPEAPLRSETASISSPVIPANVPPDAQTSFIAAYGTKASVPAQAASRRRCGAAAGAPAAGPAGRRPDRAVAASRTAPSAARALFAAEAGLSTP